MQTTLNNYSREHGDIAAAQMMLKIVELALNYDVPVEAEMRANTFMAEALELRPFYDELFGTDPSLSPSRKATIALTKPPKEADKADVDLLVVNENFNGGSYKVLKNGIEPFFRTVLWNLAYFDFQSIEAQHYDRSTAEQREMLSDLSKALYAWNAKENSAGDLERGDLVVLPKGIGGTKIQHAIHAIVKETLITPISAPGSPEKHNLVLLTLDAMGRPFVFYSNRNHTELVMKGKR